MITLTDSGDCNKTKKYLKQLSKKDFINILSKYGRKGVEALKNATPVDTGKTAESWTYKIENHKGDLNLVFINTNIQNGVPIAIILQYGHGTRNGGYVQGRDYINPAIAPIFDAMAKEAWKEVNDL